MNIDATEQPMRVVADITRRDVFFVGLRFMLRRPWIWALCAIGFVVSLWSQWHSEYRPTHWFHAVYFIVFFGAIYFGLLLAVALFTAITMVLQIPAQRGFLGSHTFEIRPDGLFESTSANQTLTSWSAIPSVIRTDRYILVSLAWWMFHLIPRRAFPSATAYDAFFHAIQQRIKQRA